MSDQGSGPVDHARAEVPHRARASPAQSCFRGEVRKGGVSPPPSVSSFESDLLVRAVAEGLVGRRAAAAEIRGIALDGKRVALRVLQFDTVALHHERPIRDRLDRDRHARLLLLLWMVSGWRPSLLHVMRRMTD